MTKDLPDFNESEKLLAAFDPQKKIYDYLDLLLAENKKLNLVSRETTLNGLIKLAAESLAPFEKELKDSLSMTHAAYLDIGTGGGFPALPIVIAGRFSSITFVERTRKKAAALERISAALGLLTQVFPDTFEELAFNCSFDLITMRLVRLNNRLLKMVISKLKTGGHFLYYADYPHTKTIRDCGYQKYSYAVGNKADSFTCTIFTKN